MELKEALKKPITIYWWNFGKKTLDFKGPYKDFFKDKDIKISKISKKAGEKFLVDVKGLRFKIPVGGATIDLKILGSSWIINDLDSAIKLFLTYLGDKTRFEGYNRIYKLNWN